MSGGGNGLLPMLGTAALGIAAPELLGAIAPEFMAGLGGAAPALTGALAGGIGSGLTGGNPLTGALTGGAGGAASGFLSGLMGGGADAVGGAAATASDVNPLDMSSMAGEGNALDPIGLPQGAAANPAMAMAPPATGVGDNISGAAPAASSGSGIGNWISKNPLQAAGVGTGVLGALFPGKANPINIGGNAGNVISTNPGFAAPLPKYQYNSTQNPYQGNWYTYGQRPQAPMVQNTLTPAKHGGLMHFASGGQVPARKPPIPPPPSMPASRELSVQDVIAALPQAVRSGLDIGGSQQPTQSAPSSAGSPLYGGYARGGKVHPNFAMGHALGRAVRQKLQSQMASSGPVSGPGGGQDDSIPAKLSNGEFVMPADVVSQLGDGSTNAGGKKLQHMIHKVRAHKATKHFPPKAKNPLAYARS